MTRSARRCAIDAATLTAIVVASVVLTWAWGALGDYPTDGGPPISDFLAGHLSAFFHHEPAMGSLAVLLRIPFAAIAFVGVDSPTPLDIYLYGSVPCVASVGLLGAWLARIAKGRGTGLAGQLAIFVVCLVNPLVQNALALGHPEELLTASVAVGALVAAYRRQELAAAVLLGLALASKQWSIVFVLPVLLLVVRRRRTLVIAVALAGAVSLPLFVGSPSTFVDTQIGLAHSHFRAPAAESWLYLPAPSVPVHISLDGHAATVSVARLSATVAGVLHPLILALAALLAAVVWRRTQGRPSCDEAFAMMALILLLRCTLDASMPYYHAALFATLLAWDAFGGGRMPTRALAVAGLAYVLGRVSVVVSPSTWSACYAAMTLLGAGLLVVILAREREPVRGSAGLAYRTDVRSAT